MTSIIYVLFQYDLAPGRQFSGETLFFFLGIDSDSGHDVIGPCKTDQSFAKKDTFTRHLSTFVVSPTTGSLPPSEGYGYGLNQHLGVYPTIRDTTIFG